MSVSGSSYRLEVDEADVTDADIINDLDSLVSESVVSDSEEEQEHSAHVHFDDTLLSSASAAVPRSDSNQDNTSDSKANDHRYSIMARAKPEMSHETSEDRLAKVAEYYLPKKETPPPQVLSSSDDLVRDILRNEQVISMPAPIEEAAKKVSFRDLFRYANRNDKVILGCSLFCAICGGALIPVMPVSIRNSTTSLHRSRLLTLMNCRSSSASLRNPSCKLDPLSLSTKS